jgi:hypothetical protein
LGVLRSGNACNFAPEGLYRPNNLAQTLHGTPVLPALSGPPKPIQQVRCQRQSRCFHSSSVFSGYFREVTRSDLDPT